MQFLNVKNDQDVPEKYKIDTHYIQKDIDIFNYKNFI